MAIAEVSVVNNAVAVEVSGTALLAPLVSAAAASASAASSSASAAATSASYINTDRNIVFCTITAFDGTRTRTIQPVNPDVSFTGDLLKYRIAYEELYEVLSGAYNIVLLNGANIGGTAFASSPVTDKNLVTLGAGGLAIGDLAIIRRRSAAEQVAQQWRLVETRNTALPALTPSLGAMIPNGKQPSADRPTMFVRSDRNVDYVSVRPHSSHYRGSYAGKQRGSDALTLALYNMRDFHSDGGSALAVNSYFSKMAGRNGPALNALFSALDSGVTVNTGMVGTTVDFVMVILGNDQTVANAYVSGFNHGGFKVGSVTTTLTPMLNDASTGTITAATRANPLVLSISSNSLINGETFVPRGVGGMTQIEGVSLTVTAVGTTVAGVTPVTIGAVNSSSYGVFTTHTGGIERTQADLTTLAVPSERYFDRLVRRTSAQNVDNLGRVLAATDYDLTIEQGTAAARFKSRTVFSTAEATPALQRAWGVLWAATDCDRVAVYAAGVVVGIYTVNLRDDSSTSIVSGDEWRFYCSDDPTVQVQVKSALANGKTHREDTGSGLVEQNRPGDTDYIANFSWGVKLYALGFGDQTGVSKFNMTGKTIETEYTVSLLYDATPVLP